MDFAQGALVLALELFARRGDATRRTLRGAGHTRRAHPPVAAAALRTCAFAALLAIPGCHHAPPHARGGGPAQRPPPGELWLAPGAIARMELRIEPVTVRPIEDPVVTGARVAFDDSAVTHVFSPVSGRIVRIEAQLGSRVRRGQVLAQILSPDVGSASADLTKAEADAVAAEHDMYRQRELLSEGAASRRDVEQAEDVYGRARAELLRARERMRLLRGGAFDRVTQQFGLRAPIDGEVIARNANPGTELSGQYTGGSGTAGELFTIGELDHVWVLGDLYEVDLARVRVGAAAIVSVVAYPGRTFTGRVDWVSGALDPQTHTARVRCTVANPDRELRPEMYATLSIATPAPTALALPRDAVLRLGDQTVVYVDIGRTREGKVRLRRTPVDVDETIGGPFLPVRAGVAAGDQVVSAGAIQLADMY